MPRKKQENTSYDSLDITRGGIWIIGKNGPYKVCNFGLRILFRIQSPYGDISWLIAVQQQQGDDTIIPMTNKEFASPGSFHEVLLKYGFVFRGDKVELHLIKEALIPDAEQAEAVSSLGFHAGSGLYFFFNGALTPGGAFLPPDANGMIRYEKHAYFLPFAQEANSKNVKTLMRYQYEQGKTTAEAWIKLIAAAHSRKAVIPVCFKLAALFRDIAFQQCHFFPILYLRGVPGAGKSTCARSMTAIDGKPQEDANLKSPNTTKSIPRRLEQVSNSAVWFDEYDNHLNEGVLGTLQAAYDGGGYQRAVNGFSNLTNSIDINSALILTANPTPDTEFMRQRCVFITFADPKKTNEQREAFSRLTGLELGNLSSVIAELLSYRALIAKEWKKTHHALYQAWIKALPNVESRICNNLAVIMTPAIILQKAKKLDIQKLFGLKESLQETGQACCAAQQEILSGKSDLTQFFEILAYCAERRILKEGEDYMYSKDGKRLAIRMPRVYPVYLREFRALYNRVGAERADLLGELSRHACYMGEGNCKFRHSERRGSYAALKIDADKMAISFPLMMPRQPHSAGEDDLNEPQ